MPAGFSSPVEQVRAMRMQGFDNAQIIATLQRDGYPASLISDAFNKADVVPESGAAPMMAQSSMMGQASVAGPTPFEQQSPFEQGGLEAPSPAAAFQEHVSEIHPESSGSETEELVEAIIDEKWNDLVKDINKIIDWKNSAEARLATIEARLNDLSRQFDKVYQALVGKIGEYDSHILEVGAELKAMEKVFSKVLPTFTENVKQLADITEELKRVR